jgi:hypothetical protein
MGQQRYIVRAFWVFICGAILTLFAVRIFSTHKTENPNTGATTIDANLSARKKSINEEKGKELYSNKCMVCHASFNADDGPRLTFSAVEDRWPDKQELIAYVKNSKNHNLKEVTDSQIQMILEYIYWELNSRN